MIYLIKIGFLDFRLVDILDILAVSFLLYQVYKLMKGSVAIRIFLGFLFLYLIYLVVRAIDMELLSAILGQFMGVGVIAVIILFQQEIRKFLLMIGKTTFFNRDNFFKSMWSREETTELNITQVVEAAKSMGGSNTGALIVFSRDTELKFYAESGDIIDAEVSKRLLLSIFNKYSPLHDGAVILHKNRIKAARCVLPVTERDNLPAQFGMRHRAAVGMSEVTDTLILVVSEETGQMSVARNGNVFHNLSGQEIREKIREYLTEEKKGFGQKLQDMLKDEITEMEKKENEEKKVSATSSSS
ncbi:MAG: diadenylate cyclase CdaA [Cyclobacteriaceae bacterium]|nr:diadenylate cyclase CdaA [Cyclobacteriaceae bacterium]